MKPKTKVKKILIILIACTILVAEDSFSSTTGTINGKIEVDGKERSYVLHIPKGYYLDGKEVPLLIAIHGRLGTGNQMMKTTGFNDIADREGFIVVYPDGLDRSWADGRGETPSDKKEVDDVKFISMLIFKLESKYRIDSTKIFVCGHSNGGAMTHRLGFDISERLAGIAPIGANVSSEMVKNFSSKKNIPVLFINGTADEYIPFEGGEGKSTGFIYPPVMDILNRWKDFNGCTGEVTPDTIDKFDDGTTAFVYNYNCSSKPVKLIKVVNGGHGYPGGLSQLPQWILGKHSEEINASEEIWKFFKENIN